MMKRITKLMNKKVSLKIFISSIFMVSALIYFLGYNLAMNKFNSVISYNQEKQKMYSKLSEVDYNIRDEYIGTIDEDKLYDGVCSGYIKGIDDSNCRFMTSADYKSYFDEQESLIGDVSYEIAGENTAFIKCPCLGKNFSSSFINCFNSAKSDGADSVLIDLRNTSNGTEIEVMKVLEYICPSGDIVKCVRSNGEEEVICKSTSSGSPLKIAVLVNDKTSGLAEVFASGLRDCCKSKIIGSTTAGNCVKIKTVKLSDDSVVIYPEAFYVTPGGNKLLKQGLKCDVNIESGADDDTYISQAVNELK